MKQGEHSKQSYS